MWRELKAFRHSRKIDSMFVRENRGNENLFYNSNTFDWYCSISPGLFLFDVWSISISISILYKICFKIRQRDWNISRSTDNVYPGSMISSPHEFNKAWANIEQRLGLCERDREREYRQTLSNKREDKLLNEGQKTK